MKKIPALYHEVLKKTFISKFGDDEIIWTKMPNMQERRHLQNITKNKPGSTRTAKHITETLELCPTI